MDLIERKIKDKQSDKWGRNSKNRQIVDFSRGHKDHAYWKNKLSSFRDVCVGESEHWLILFPQNIRPLSPVGAPEPITHLQLVPKEHYNSAMELDDNVARDL